MAIGVRIPEGHADSMLRMVLLHDSESKVLAIMPAQSLLNLSVVWKQTHRQLQPVRHEDVCRFFNQDALQREAGQKKLLSLPLLIDPQCLKHDKSELIELCSGFSFPVTRADFAGAVPCQLSVTTAEIAAEQPSGDDETVITRAVERFTALRIKQRLEDTLDLPSLSPTVQQIIMLRSDPDAGVADLVPVVKVDPSLSAQVMSWAASPYYAAPGDVHSIDDAVIRVLGFDLVVNMALGTGMGKVLKVPKDGPRGGTPFWLQSVYNACLAEKLCKQMPADIRPQPGMAYLAGLLHNFGYLVLAHLFAPQFSLLIRYIEANPHFQLHQVEQQVLNVTREQIGSWLLSSWALPEAVCTGIRHQNQPGYTGEHAHMAQLLYLANRMLRQEGLADGPLEEPAPEVYKTLGLTPEQARAALDKLLTEDSAIRALSTMLEQPGQVA
ncbi:HDOD domain-containing protein [Neptuniibacter sp. CAU 1671]|uniref:HDOD domain-containing protein n=1 Tax=Neptuniibacter sp. CAU 1671 TaxID=3032593 RepID=UPI0023DA2D72|nr:HDOD domain-containing protein [Neptuniibacter sp. CAU 1671]MDF2182593.1 HDOD domain-containing protein [Neptuniibacter sp. CAU 1671]